MIFELRWDWHDDYWQALYEGKEISQEEWQNLCKSAILEVAPVIIEKNAEKGISLLHFLEEVEPVLASMGYKGVKPVSFGFEGTDYIEDCVDIPYTSLRMLRDIIGRELYGLALRRNQQYERKIDQLREVKSVGD